MEVLRTHLDRFLSYVHQVVAHIRSNSALPSTLRLGWTRGKDAPWITLVAVPLAMNAAGLLQLWWLWPPLLALGYLGSPSWRWSCLLTLQLAVIGTEWAYVGAMTLRTWPDHRVEIGFIWAGTALALAIAGGLSRRHLTMSGQQVGLVGSASRGVRQGAEDPAHLPSRRPS